jgi:hypothetical protein
VPVKTVTVGGGRMPPTTDGNIFTVCQILNSVAISQSRDVCSEILSKVCGPLTETSVRRSQIICWLISLNNLPDSLRGAENHKKYHYKYKSPSNLLAIKNTIQVKQLTQQFSHTCEFANYTEPQKTDAKY